jgi:glycosyltransferase involved in cell wall biosynthesis
MLVKTFCETFKTLPSATRPALILKTSGADFSVLDREEILSKINAVRDTIGVGCPNVYLIHGDLSRQEMNSLYNHPKVKVHVSFTKGEGFGRPLLEASMSEKPIIASGWSGHLDFLNPQDAILLNGELRQVEPGAVWDNIIIPQSSWFNVDTSFASKALMLSYKKYDNFLPGARRLAKTNKEKFGYDVIKENMKELLKKHIPSHIMTPPKLVPLNLGAGGFKMPTLKKLGASTPAPVTEESKEPSNI